MIITVVIVQTIRSAVLCWCVQWTRRGQTGQTGQRARSPAEAVLSLGRVHARQACTVVETVWETPPRHRHAAHSSAQVSSKSQPSFSICTTSCPSLTSCAWRESNRKKVPKTCRSLQQTTDERRCK